MMGNTFSYGSTGYAANPEVNLQDVIINIIHSILNNFIAQGMCTPDIAQEVYLRFQANMNAITNNIRNRFVSNGQCNTDQIYNYLANTDIPATIQDIKNQMMNNRNYGYNQPLFSGNGYNNYGGNFNNPSWSRPQSYNNYMPQNTGFGNPNSIMSSGAVSSMHGYGKAVMSQNNNTIPTSAPTQTAPNNPEINTNPYLPKTKNQFNNTEPVVVTSNENSLAKIFKESFNDRITRRNNRISIDKITTDTSSITNNKEYIANKINTEQLAIVRGDKNFTDTKNIQSIQNAKPESPEYCEISNTIDITHNGTVVNSSSYDLIVPVVNAQEAINLVKEAAPNLTEQEQWIAVIQYKELITKKIPNFGAEAQDAFRAIGDSLNKVHDLKDISNIIIPIVKKQISEVRQYIEALVVDRINELFKTSLYRPDDPTAYPKIKSWNGIFQMVDESNPTNSDYLAYMFDRFGDTYVNNVFLCVKSALNDIFVDSDDDDVVVRTDSDAGIALIGKLSEVTCIAGKYRFCDYGYAPESHMESLIKQFNKDYIVHKFSQEALVTNINIDEMLGSVATNTVIEVSSNLPQHVIQQLFLGVKSKGVNRDMILIEMDKSSTYINKVFRINIDINNRIFISRD